MTPHLFVYGSLMSTAGHAMGARLRGEARLLGEATIAGRLYRVSWYPGAVGSHEPSERVHGEVYALADPARSLAWLDLYEGIVAGEEEAGEYRRLERSVRLASGEELSAWVYFLQNGAVGLTQVPDGRWTAEPR